jgi:adenine-specific DNA-methyltransferase
MMYPRLELLRELLSEDGSIWISCDDAEGHYLKVLMDELYGRNNFIATVIWQKRVTRENRAALGTSHDYILVYARKPAVEWKAFRNLLPANEAGYANPDNDPRGPWRSIPFSAQGYRPNQMYKIRTPAGVELDPPKGRCWGATEPEFNRYLADNRIFFPKDGRGRPRIKNFKGDERGLAPMTFWPASEVGNTEESKKEILALFDEDTPFATPKPERLISRILEIASNPSDIVLDSFLGSGTTAAVAHKLGRHWIGIEMGDHAMTHCQPRLCKVIAGEHGGISEEVGWKGGGGFRFVKLGDTLFDAFGRLNPKVKFPHLAAYVWWRETKASAFGSLANMSSPLLGQHEGTGIYLLYNGILGDKRPEGGNVLTPAVLASLPKHEGPRIIYAEATTYSPSALTAKGITFKQIPYDLGSMPLLAEGALEFAAGISPAFPEEGGHV